jgi:hypothetical protein
VSRDIRLHHERVIGVAVTLGVVLSLYFLLTPFAVAATTGASISCGGTVGQLAQSESTSADPTGACHAGAVTRLHLALGYLSAGLGVALGVWLVGGLRERSLNRAWAQARTPARWLSTPGELWVLAALLFVVLAGVAQGGIWGH